MTDLKKQRMATGLTMREHCLKYGLDPVAYSKLERGVTGPMTDEELMGKLPIFIKTNKLDQLAEDIRNS